MHNKNGHICLWMSKKKTDTHRFDGDCHWKCYRSTFPETTQKPFLSTI